LLSLKSRSSGTDEYFTSLWFLFFLKKKKKTTFLRGEREGQRESETETETELKSHSSSHGVQETRTRFRELICKLKGAKQLPEGVAAPTTTRLFSYATAVRQYSLGARDSLRLEAGLCLYGNDLDDTTTPSEGNLLWTIPKSRRADGGFVGAETILGQIADKKLVKRKRVGFVGSGPPPRGGDKLFTPEGEEVGVVTSGVYGPSLKKPVGMAYVRKKFMKAGTKLQAEVRGKKRDVEITKMPFVEPGYYRG